MAVGWPDAAGRRFLVADDMGQNLVADPLKRFSIGDRTKGLKYGDDGSLTVYIQSERPAQGPGIQLAARAARSVSDETAGLFATEGDCGSRLSVAAGPEER